MNALREKFNESLAAVLPVTAIIILLSISVAPLSAGVVVLFLFGCFLVIFGMSLFTLGAGLAMQPLGEGIGVEMSKSKRIALPLAVCFALGVIITLAEPDLTVLAEQIPSIPNRTLILTVAVGVGGFLVLALLKTVFSIPLARLLLLFYALTFVLAFFAPRDFIPAAFDSGGVTTGPITVPFIMAFGVGMASLRSDRNSAGDSFGLIALCSIGPILSVLLLSIIFRPEATAAENTIAEVATTADALRVFVDQSPKFAGEVALACLPIIGVFAVFEVIFRRFKLRELIRIASGFLYTFAGLVLFLTGANVGFMPAGQLIGAEIGASDYKLLLIPVGMGVGYFIVAAEPAVIVLKKQVEDVSAGQITQRTIGLGLSVGVACSVGLAMLRIVTGIPIMYFLLPGYAVSLLISFFVPPLYTGIAFDSGGVASGPMTTAFLLPFAHGACAAVGGDLLTDAFGIVAMVAMTPLITIQCIGLFSEIRKHARARERADILSRVEDDIIRYDAGEESEA